MDALDEVSLRWVRGIVAQPIAPAERVVPCRIELEHRFRGADDLRIHVEEAVLGTATGRSSGGDGTGYVRNVPMGLNGR